MPLTWNIGAIEKYKDDLDSAYIEYEENGKTYYDLDPKVKTFVFWGGAVGIGYITKDNAAEYYARSKVIEKVVGEGFMFKWGEDNEREQIYMEKSDVKEMIGLSTNHGFRNTTEWTRIFHENNKNKSPGIKVIKAMITVYKHEYEAWEKQNENR